MALFWPPKWPNLLSKAKNPKNKGTFFSSVLKVEEKKVTFFVASGLRYRHFLIFGQNGPVLASTMTKWPYLSPEAKNPKDKGSFFSSVLNVLE